MIRTRSTRLVQPSGLAQIDWGSPQVSGLAFALSGVDGRDRVRGVAIAKTNSLSTGLSRYGAGFSSAANSAFSSPLDLSGTNEITVSFVLVLRANTTAVLVEHTPTYNTSAGSFLIYADGGNLLAGVSSGGGGASGYNVSQCAAPALNTPVRVVVTLRRTGTTAKACRIWIDGAEQVTTQPNNGEISGNFANSTTYFLGRGATSIFANAIVQDPAIFGRLLSDGEAASLSRNPWQLFKPTERRIFVPVSTGGGVGTASGTLASLSLSPSTAGASGAAQASAALASLAITPATATASGGAAIVGNASAALASLSMSAAQASASGAASASAALVGVYLTPAQAAATGAASASASLAALSITPASASAYGGTSVPATASAALASLSVTPAQATASGAATAAGPMVGMNMTPAQAAAAGAAWASAELRSLSITPATATANDGTAPSIDWSAPGARALVPQASVRAITPAANVRAIVPYAGADMDIIKTFDHQVGDTEIYELAYGPKYLDPLGDTPATLAAFSGGHAGITPEVVVGQPAENTVKFAVDGTVPVGSYVVSAQLATAAGRKKTAAVQVNVET